MKKFLLAILILPSILSCSLKYEDENSAESGLPEFTFTNAKFNQYENKKLSLQLNADILEQYTNSKQSFAQNSIFSTWNKEGKLISKGSCNLLGMDTNNKIYTLFNNISIQNFDQNFSLQAQNLKWNGNTEQITSGKDETVYIKRDDIELSGKGFSASAVSRSFQFLQPVQGIISTKDNESSDESTQDENLNK